MMLLGFAQIDTATITAACGAVAGAVAGILGAYAAMRLKLSKAKLTEAQADVIEKKADDEIEKSQLDRIEERLEECESDRKILHQTIDEMRRQHALDMVAIQTRFLQLLDQLQKQSTPPGNKSS